MKSVFKPLLICTVIASSALAAYAQTDATPPTNHQGMHHRHMDPAKVQEMVAKRQAALKAKLNLSSSQEAAWATYVAAMQPPADLGQRMGPEARKKMRDEWAELTTPQRIDKMNQMRAQRDAEMAQRGDAIKSLYAALTPEQQKIFDASSMRHRGPGGWHGNAAKG